MASNMVDIWVRITSVLHEVKCTAHTHAQTKKVISTPEISKTFDCKLEFAVHDVKFTGKPHGQRALIKGT